MKYISLIAVVAIALVIGWFILTADNSADYVALVTDDVAALEQELVAVEAQVQAGTLSPAAASEARGRIINRINAIQASAAASGNTELTVSQRQQLSEGLDRLKSILLTYQATLVAVDTTADTDSRSVHTSDGSSLTAQLADTVDSFENVVTEVDDTYEADASVDAAIDAAVDEAESMTNEATSSVAEDNGTISDDETSSLGMPATDATTTDEMIVEVDTASTTEEITQ